MHNDGDDNDAIMMIKIFENFIGTTTKFNNIGKLKQKLKM